MTNPYENQLAIKTLLNLEQYYEAWILSKRLTQASFFWRRRGETDYLYKRVSGVTGSIEKSLGGRSKTTEAQMNEWINAKALEKNSKNQLQMLSATCRVYKLPQLSPVLGNLLRQLDIDEQNGDKGVMVVGTNALYAYEQEAMIQLPETLMETDDMDLAWRRTTPWNKMEMPILDSIKRADPTWTINTERSFQALDKNGNELEVLAAGSVLPTLGRKGFKTVDIPEQE